MLVSRRVAAVLAVALSAGFIGCGSSEGDDEGDVSGQPQGEPLQIYFKTLNTAFIPGSSRKFQVPAVVQGVKPDKWECSDKSAVDFDYDTVPNGVMITARKAGKFKITATAGKRVGSVDLNVTSATDEQYKKGEERYNNAIQLMFTPGMIAGIQLMNNVSCKNCHGSGAQFLAVEHTPQQTGGYSDEEISNIFKNGMKPAGAPWGSLPGIMNYYPLFHKWMASDEEYQGLVVYLRSMEPKPQGDLDFMGLVNMFRGMFPRPGGGMGAAGGAAPGMTGTAGSTPAM